MKTTTPLQTSILVLGLLALSCVFETTTPQNNENAKSTTELMWTAWGRSDSVSHTTITTVDFDSVYFYQKGDTNCYLFVWGIRCDDDTLYDLGRQGTENGAFVMDAHNLYLYSRIRNAIPGNTTGPARINAAQLPISRDPEYLAFPDHIDGSARRFTKDPTVDLRYPVVTLGNDTTLSPKDTLNIKPAISDIGSPIRYLSMQVFDQSGKRINNPYFLDSEYLFTAPSKNQTYLFVFFADNELGYEGRDSLKITVSDSLGT